MNPPPAGVKPLLSVNTLAFHGYPMAQAFEQIREIGFEYVEPALISNYYEEMTDSYFSQSTADEMRRSMQAHGLRAIALSAHMDMGLERSVDSFRKRMDVAYLIGASYIHTNATAWGNYRRLMSTLEKLIPVAEANGLVICLENPGDGECNVVGSGKEGAQLISHFASKNLRLNYDFSNAISYSKGKADIDRDFRQAAPYVAHVHLKDMRPLGTGWVFTPIGSGSTGYREIFTSILEQEFHAPMSIELPLRFKRAGDFKIMLDRRVKPCPLRTIRQILRASKDFVEQHLGNVQPSGSVAMP
jgi:sugar phosphate isomerase/epimerase